MAGTIYEKPTKLLMREFADQTLEAGQSFTRKNVTDWFAQHYPKIKSGTVTAHCEGMSVNSENRKHHPSIKPGSNHDLFFKIGRGEFRLWDAKSDPPPIYPLLDSATSNGDAGTENEPVSDDDNYQSGSEFAAERDLQKYLIENLNALEPGLRLYDEEGMTGFEYPAGGRYIDILAVDGNDDLVVIELKVSRGYDRVIGQLLRYMGWVEAHLADDRKVRGWIVARDITDDLKLATSRLEDVSLFEYRINFEISRVSPV